MITTVLGECMQGGTWQISPNVPTYAYAVCIHTYHVCRKHTPMCYVILAYISNIVFLSILCNIYYYIILIYYKIL